MLPGLRRDRDLDFVVANGENAAGGAGITVRTFEELLDAGVDVVTTGNHVYRHREVQSLLLSEEDRLLRLGGDQRLEERLRAAARQFGVPGGIEAAEAFSVIDLP